MLIARDLCLHDPPRVLAWRLLHEPSLRDLPGVVSWLLPRTPEGFDRDPLALLLAAAATTLAFLYLTLALFGAGSRARFAVIATAAVLLVALPSLAFVAMGARADRPYGQDGGVVQLPLALDKILAGQSPYGADYSDSVLGRQARTSSFWEPYGGNPILHHHAYLPGTHAIFMPFYLALGKGLGFFDPRFVTLLAYGLAALLAVRLAEGPASRLVAAAVVLLNPLVYWHQIFGANDVVFVAVLLGAFLLARRGHATFAGVALGVACATKQLAWPFAPFLLLYFGGATAWRGLLARDFVRRAAKPAAAALATFLVLVVPVAALDPRAFYGDIVAYNVGLPGADNYPLGGTPGFGFANLLIYFGRVQSLRDYFPFGIFYLFLAPLGLGLVRAQLRAPALATAILNGGVALLASLYFSRVVHPNYLVPLAILIPLAILLGRREGSVAAVPLLLLGFAVEVVENAVFRPTWDQAVAAGYPRAVTGLFARLLPLAGPSLTVDPIGLLVSGVAAGLAVATLAACALGAGSRVRAILAGAGFVVAVLLPTVFMISVSARTGIRGQDRSVVQTPADADRLAAGASPFRAPVADRPQGRQAWSTSFRLEPPALLEPDRPAMPPGASTLLAPVRLFGGSADPRWLTLLALAGLMVAALASGRRMASEVSSLFFLAPMALGAIFGSPHALTAAVVFAAGWAARSGRPAWSGILAGVAAALHPIAIPAVPFLILASAPDGPHRRRAWMAAAAAFGLLVLPVFVLDAGAFLEAVGRGPESGPGLGLANVFLYAGLTRYGGAMAVVVGGLIALALSKTLAKPLAKAVSGSGAGALWALASVATLLVVMVSPGAPADAIAVPLALGLLAVLPFRTPDGSAVPP